MASVPAEGWHTAIWPTRDVKRAGRDKRRHSMLLRMRGTGKPVEPMGDDGTIIRGSGVVKSYDTGANAVNVLKGVDFTVRRGELVAVMGPSGCGKTTLLNCLSGLDDVDSGEIFVEGKNIAAMPDKARTAYRARRMGFVFQVYNLLPVLSAVENVELPLLVSGTRPNEARRRAMAALDRVGLADRASHRPAELSGGQRQRVTLARALVNNPALVWADEPTGALDSNTANEIMHLLRDLNRRDGLTGVIVTHDQEIGNRCDRIVRMRDGYVIDHAATGWDGQAPALAG